LKELNQMNPVTSTTDPLAPIQALPNVAPLAQVAAALQAAFATMRAHVQGALAREVAQRGIIELLETKRIDGATRLVQLAAAESRIHEEKAAPLVPEGGGTPLEFTDPEPWPDPVDGAAWLDEVVALLRTYLVLPDQAAEAIALWIMQTYTLEAANIAPILTVVSPEANCGKSSVVTLAGWLCRRPLLTSNVTPSVLFRVVDKAAPTLVIDEADSFLKDNEAMRGIINSGHTRPTARVLRSVGDHHEPRWFSTWGSKAIARIGKFTGPWETVASRSIIVSMRRRLEKEPITLMPQEAPPPVEVLTRQAVRWSRDHMDRLRETSPPERPGLANRVADNWRPLFAIAELVGSGWPEKATHVAFKLSDVKKQRTSQPPGVLLLEDIRKYFGKGGPGTDKVATIDLVVWLTTDPDLIDRPWRTYYQGKPINKNGVANLLDGYEIKPDHRWRDGGRQTRGFRVSDFADAWERYLLPETEEAEAAEEEQVAA